LAWETGLRPFSFYRDSILNHRNNLGAIDYFIFIQNLTGTQLALLCFFGLHLFPFWASILNMVRLALVYDNTCYAFTNKRLMMRSGFWGIDFKAIDYDKIADLEVNVNPIEDLFGVGTILAYSGRTGDQGRQFTDRFTAISNPYQVFKKIKEVSVDIKTDWNYPNAMRPAENPGYQTQYNPKK
jgi:hypothetical protein